MFKPIYLETENELNKILKGQKRTGEEVHILFTSLWDKWCTTLVNKLERKSEAPSRWENKKVYVVDSFSMPHAFIIFRTTKLPHLVSLGRYSPVSEDYLPIVYKSLGILV